jgi:hypothetical protein
MNQFIQTLAQLSAVLVTSTLAVPAYSYYTRGTFFKPKVEIEELFDDLESSSTKDDLDLEDEVDNDLENDADGESN